MNPNTTTNMKTKTTTSPIKMSPLALAGIGLIAACLPSHAAVLSFSTGAPTVNGADISSFTGTTSDAGNVLNGDDSGTYVANDQGAQGQTFTTGSNLGGYTLSAVTLQHVNYSTFFNLNSTSSLFTVRVGTVAAGAFGSLASETAASGGPGNPGGFTNANGSSLFLTFTLATPITLSPNTVYGFDVGSNGSFFESFRWRLRLHQRPRRLRHGCGKFRCDRAHRRRPRVPRRSCSGSRAILHIASRSIWHARTSPPPEVIQSHDTLPGHLTIRPMAFSFLPGICFRRVAPANSR